MFTSAVFMRLVVLAAAIGIGYLAGKSFGVKSSSPWPRWIGVGLILAFIFMIVLIAADLPGWIATGILAVCLYIVAKSFSREPVDLGDGSPPITFGSSRWANADDVRQNDLFEAGGLRLGAALEGKKSLPISYKGERHLLTVAPTRSGKGTSHIIPNLLKYPGSVLVIDPKGENARITAQARRDMGQEVHIVDPWGIAAADAGFEPSHFNPLDWLEEGDIDITENAMILADALVVQGDHRDAFWEEEAKALLQGLILFVATSKSEQGRRHLGNVRNMLLKGDVDLERLFDAMKTSSHGVVSSTAMRTLQKEAKLRSNVFASAQAQTHFLDSKRIIESVSQSDFRFEDLKTKPMTVYLVLPADRLHAFGRWLRLLVQQAITVNARNIGAKPEHPVLFLLDEMPALGKLSKVEEAYGLMAGFGMQIWGIVQDLPQLKRVYGDTYESFIANSGAVSYFGSPDKMSADYFSALCGVTTVWDISKSWANALSNTFGGQSGSTTEGTTGTDSFSAKQRQLAYPDELMRLHGDRQLIFIEEMFPISGQKAPWYEDDELKRLGRDIRSVATSKPINGDNSDVGRDTASQGAVQESL